MKKLLLVLVVLLVSGITLGQDKNVIREKKSSLIIHAGPSFPVGSFNSKDFMKNENSGYAKTGYTINLDYGYQFHKNVGAAASVFYNKYNVDQLILIPANGSGSGGGVFNESEESPSIPVTLKLDHWKIYGLAVGPMLTFNIADKINTNLRLMGGVVNTNSPKAVDQSQSVSAKEDWRLSGVLKGGLDFRIGVGSNVFVFTNFDYMYTKPKFKIEYFIGSDADLFTRKQKITAINLTGGVGFKF